MRISISLLVLSSLLINASAGFPKDKPSKEREPLPSPEAVLTAAGDSKTFGELTTRIRESGLRLNIVGVWDEDATIKGFGENFTTVSLSNGQFEIRPGIDEIMIVDVVSAKPELELLQRRIQLPSLEQVTVKDATLELKRLLGNELILGPFNNSARVNKLLLQGKEASVLEILSDICHQGRMGGWNLSPIKTADGGILGYGLYILAPYSAPAKE